ncbi:MAG: hypothetical protein RLZZ385_53 [Pseudomonadota bacterium]
MPSSSKPFATRLVNLGPTLLLFSLLLGTLLAIGLRHTGFDTSLEALLTESDPYINEVNEMAAQFDAPQTVTYAIVNPSGSAFTPEVIAALEDLQSLYREVPYATRLSSLLGYRSPETGQALFARPASQYSPEELLTLAPGALQDPLLRNGLLSTDGRLTFATLEIDVGRADTASRMAVADAAVALQDTLKEAHQGLDIHVSADVMFEQSTRDAMLRDLIYLLPFVILICVATICYCFHSFAFGVCILSQALLTVLCTVGLLGHLGLAFNSISVIAPLVVVIIAVAHSVHIISIFRQRLHGGDDYRTAMVYSIDYNFKPVLLATVTTAIGFLSLNLCSSPAIQDFGRIVALGISFAFVFTFSLLPTLLVWVASRIPSHGRGSDAALPRRVIELAKSLWLRHDRKLFIGVCLTAIITTALLPLNQTDFNRLDFIQSGSALRDYYDAVSEHLNRGPALTYGIEVPAGASVIEPAFLEQVDQFANWLREQPEIESVASLVEVVKTISRAKGAGDPGYYRIPDDGNTIAMDLSLYQSFELDDFPLDGFINFDDSMLRLFVNAVPMSNQSIIDLDGKLSAAFAQQMPGARLLHGSGLLLFARMDERVTVELLQGYSLSLALITLTLIIGFRSVYFGLLSVIPNLLPATMVFGLWGLLVGQLDPFVMMLFSISIGLVVDDTVHILTHYLDNRAAGAPVTQAVNRALDEAGPALVVTTGVLALGTTLLIFANTLYFQQAAKLLVPIVVLALALDLVFLPTVLKRFDRLRIPQKSG